MTSRSVAAELGWDRPKRAVHETPFGLRQSGTTDVRYWVGRDLQTLFALMLRRLLAALGGVMGRRSQYTDAKRGEIR
ncbi:hypothetical protein BN973_01943 [Mycobacterium triplex]|uniref:Transposase n=1 Tax=Mycobacterium triplex TaxID=47839 RepID=A0A024JWH6_9MYCO|nr:hypothetical protein BN973_01943 [Mycobacterium triplex]